MRSSVTTSEVYFQERQRLAEEREAIRARERGRRPRPVRFGRSAKTIRNVFVPFREMLGQAVKWDYLEVNPAIGIELPEREWKDEEKVQALSGPEVERLLAAAPSEYSVCALASSVRCGGVTWTGTVTGRGCMCAVQ